MPHSDTLATFVFLAMKSPATRTDEEDQQLHYLYARRRSFIPEVLASRNAAALEAEWQLAEANYEQQYPTDNIALLLGAEAVNG